MYNDMAVEKISAIPGIFDLDADTRAFIFSMDIICKLCHHGSSEYGPHDPTLFSSHPMLVLMEKMAPPHCVVYIGTPPDRLAIQQSGRAKQYTWNEIQQQYKKFYDLYASTADVISQGQPFRS
jgi:hypothetical protein